jgi:branched-chain amino acid aminotransferase
MTTTPDLVSTDWLTIHQAETSGLSQVDFGNIPFGQVFADHMLVSDYKNGQWTDARIEPFGNLSLSPACLVFHYGQAIFEGMKAYKDDDGNVVMFRARDNFLRFNRSAVRMCMPEVPEYLFMEGLRQLLELDRDWVPDRDGSALYIRPFMIATDEYLGVKPSQSYKFMVFTCPVGAYYPEPIKLKIEQHYTRASGGGIGYAKAGANYASSLYPAKLAQQEGHHQLIWTDAEHHEYIEESGTMNLFFVIDGEIFTADLDGRILAGITRASAIRLLRDHGYTVHERKLSVTELLQAFDEGKLTEVFGTGTAATIAFVDSVAHNDKQLPLPPAAERPVSLFLKEKLDNIKKGREEDPYNWVERI